MKLAMMSYTMTRQEGFNAKEMFKLTCELKLQGMDIVGLHGRPAKEWKKMADDYGIPVIAHTFSADLNTSDPILREKGIDEIKRGLENAAILGAPVIMVVTPGKKGEDRSDARKRWIIGLKKAIEHAKKVGITLTVENFPGAYSPFVIADDFLEAVAEIPELRLTFDSGNTAGGENPADSFRKCNRYVVHAHFKDWIRSEKEHGCLMLNGEYWQGELIGRGIINHSEVINQMQKAGYAGYIDIEYEGNSIPAKDAVRIAADYLRELGCK